MLDFVYVFEFSRQNCIAICSVLVPLNLLTTITVMVLVGLKISLSKVRILAIMETIWAITTILHVSTWFMIGVIQLTTFILIGLSLTCLILTWGSILFSSQFQQVLSWLKIIIFERKMIHKLSK